VAVAVLSIVPSAWSRSACVTVYAAVKTADKPGARLATETGLTAPSPGSGSLTVTP
jgi:hypothetical protein